MAGDMVAYMQSSCKCFARVARHLLNALLVSPVDLLYRKVRKLAQTALLTTIGSG